ncbi:MAG TPA: sulfite exporter TauE/SafE family protein [Verrucomicrobiae bacterium]|nr:sulfite exporter TauE/SafE family protein [Verrucomicrobiae bacterium]
MNLGAAFLLGLAGSLHCAVMCGPLVLALCAARRGRSRPILDGLSYHGGRIALYGLLGAICGLLGAALAWAGLQRWLSIAAGAAILAAALGSFRGGLARVAPQFVAWLKIQFGRWLRRESSASVALLGAINGLLPCGLVYVACAAAAAGGSVGQGTATMLAFGLGTAPMMLSITLGGGHFAPFFARRARGVVLACSVAAGILLILRGLAATSPGACPACHRVEIVAPRIGQRLPIYVERIGSAPPIVRAS